MARSPLAHPRVAVPSPVVDGARVRLRPATAADAPALLEVSVYDGVAARDVAEARAQLARTDADQARGESLHWGIEDVASGELAGTVGFYRGFADGVGEVGYVLRPAFRGRGLMTDAVRAAVGHGLGALGLRAVVARTDADNHASIAVLERCGFAPAATEGEGRAFRLACPGA